MVRSLISTVGKSSWARIDPDSIEQDKRNNVAALWFTFKDTGAHVRLVKTPARGDYRLRVVRANGCIEHVLPGSIAEVNEVLARY